MKARINGKTYELPKLTLSVIEKLESYDEQEKDYESGKTKASDLYREQYKLINDILGETAVCEILQGDNIDDIDLTNLFTAILDIQAAYNAPIVEKKLEGFKDVMGKVRNDVELIDKVKNV